MTPPTPDTQGSGARHFQQQQCLTSKSARWFAGSCMWCDTRKVNKVAAMDGPPLNSGDLRSGPIHGRPYQRAISTKPYKVFRVLGGLPVDRVARRNGAIVLWVTASSGRSGPPNRPRPRRPAFSRRPRNYDRPLSTGDPIDRKPSADPINL